MALHSITAQISPALQAVLEAVEVAQIAVTRATLVVLELQVKEMGAELELSTTHKMLVEVAEEREP